MRVWVELRRWSVTVSLGDGPPDVPAHANLAHPRVKAALGELHESDADVPTALGFIPPSMRDTPE